MSELEAHPQCAASSVSSTRERPLSMELSFLRISDPALNRDWSIACQMGEIEYDGRYRRWNGRGLCAGDWDAGAKLLKMVRAGRISASALGAGLVLLARVRCPSTSASGTGRQLMHLNRRRKAREPVSTCAVLWTPPIGEKLKIHKIFRINSYLSY
jgi:hypothetical protein